MLLKMSHIILLFWSVFFIACQPLDLIKRPNEQVITLDKDSNATPVLSFPTTNPWLKSSSMGFPQYHSSGEKKFLVALIEPTNTEIREKTFQPLLPQASLKEDINRALFKTHAFDSQGNFINLPNYNIGQAMANLSIADYFNYNSYGKLQFKSMDQNPIDSIHGPFQVEFSCDPNVYINQVVNSLRAQRGDDFLKTDGLFLIVPELDVFNELQCNYVGKQFVYRFNGGQFPVVLGYWRLDKAYIDQPNHHMIGTLTHEIGHLLGMTHASTLGCPAEKYDTIPNLSGECFLYEYGSAINIMGHAKNYSTFKQIGFPRISAPNMFLSGWLDDSTQSPNYIQHISESGTYDLKPLNDFSPGAKALRIPFIKEDVFLIVEYRRKSIQNRTTLDDNMTDTAYTLIGDPLDKNLNPASSEGGLWDVNSTPQNIYSDLGAQVYLYHKSGRFYQISGCGIDENRRNQFNLFDYGAGHALKILPSTEQTSAIACGGQNRDQSYLYDPFNGTLVKVKELTESNMKVEVLFDQPAPHSHFGLYKEPQ